MKIVERIEKDYREAADEKALESGKRFFKEETNMIGVRSAEAKRIISKYRNELKERPKEEVFAVCEELWKRGVFELSGCACEFAYSKAKEFKPEDFATFERWVKNYISNWANCDALCNHTIGDFVTMYPEFTPKIKEWAKSGNRWVRRASAVTYIVPACKGLFGKEIFDTADILLTDSDDMVQKGYGWMLKAAADHETKPVFDYVMKNKAKMPRTALRYAIEKMPEELKAEAMKR